MSDPVVVGDREGITWITDVDSFVETAAMADFECRIPVEATIAVTSPWQAYRRARSGEWNVCFETLGERGGWNAFGIDPSATLTVWPDDIGSRWEHSLEALRDVIDAEAIHLPADTQAIPGGWFGWISYDVAREYESLPSTTIRDRVLPRLQFARYDTIATWETPMEDPPVELRLSSCPRIGDDPMDAYRRGCERIERFVERILEGTIETPWGDPSGMIEFTPGIDRAEYCRRVQQVKDYIRDGETFQVNLSQRFDGDATIHPVDTYEALRLANPAPYNGLLETPSVDLVSTSPELLLERHGDRVRTEPIAGTRPRGETPEADRALATELSTDEKERAEHAMLVDLERNDLGRICVPGSVEVSEYRRVDRYASVWHLVSEVVGRLEPDVELDEIIAAMLPGGTVTGAPKPRTMAIIDELEDRRRGPYTGSMAVIGFDGTIRANMVIRTLEGHNRRYRLRVGGGIVHDSDPNAEYEETLAKAAAIRDAISLEGDVPP